jgi:hypothetical protein
MEKDNDFRLKPETLKDVKEVLAAREASDKQEVVHMTEQLESKILGLTNWPARLSPSELLFTEAQPKQVLKKGTKMSRDIHTGLWRELREGEYTMPESNTFVLTEDLPLPLDQYADLPLAPYKSYETRAREIIKEGLLDLEKRLGELCQTTHGRSPCRSMGDLQFDLSVAWYNPTAYTISNLSQAINYFCKVK